MGMNNSFKKKDAFKNAHNIHRQRRGGSLKNTKINYTKDLLCHCLLNFWEDFAILCVVCVSCVSPGSLSFFSGGKKQIIFVALSSTRKCRRSVFSKVKSTVMTYQESPGGHTWFFMEQIRLEQPKREEN